MYLYNIFICIYIYVICYMELRGLAMGQVPGCNPARGAVGLFDVPSICVNVKQTSIYLTLNPKP